MPPQQDTQLAQVATTLQSLFGWVPAAFKIERNKSATNNHVYIIQLVQPLDSELPIAEASQPFVCPVPAGTSQLVMRIPKLDNNVNDTIRIRNEVAFLHLAREALSAVDSTVVPRVFTWRDGRDTRNDDSRCASYILEEFKKGESLSAKELEALSDEAKASISSQLARVVAAWQSFELPSSIRGYGGITFDDSGEFSSTSIIFGTGGPFNTYAAYLKSTILWQLRNSERVPAINGWRTMPDAPGLRARIDAFIDRGLDDLLARVPHYKMSLVHGDLSEYIKNNKKARANSHIALPNLLFNRAENKLTAILDFDFGHIGIPLTEFLYSFPEFNGLLGGAADEADGVRELVLGQPLAHPLPEKDIGNIWQKALLDCGALTPSTMDGADLVSNIWWFSQELLYFHWLVPRAVDSMSEDTKRRFLQKSAEAIQVYLSLWGY